MDNFYVLTASRWAHILAGVVLVGGVLFDAWVVLPALQASSEGATLREAVNSRWRKLVGAASGFLLLSGFINFFALSIDKAKEIPLYHPVFGVKFLAAFGVFFLSSALAGKSRAFEGMRANPAKWVKLNVALSVVVVLLGGVLKNSDRLV